MHRALLEQAQDREFDHPISPSSRCADPIYRADITGRTIAPTAREGGLVCPHGCGRGGVVGVPGAGRGLRPRRCRGRDGGVRGRPGPHAVALLRGGTSGRAGRSCGGSPTWMAGLPGSFTIAYDEHRVRVEGDVAWLNAAGTGTLGRRRRNREADAASRDGGVPPGGRRRGDATHATAPSRGSSSSLVGSARRNQIVGPPPGAASFVDHAEPESLVERDVVANARLEEGGKLRRRGREPGHVRSGGRPDRARARPCRPPGCRGTSMVRRERVPPSQSQNMA